MVNYQKKSRHIQAALCACKHNIPNVEYALFPRLNDPCDVMYLEEMIEGQLAGVEKLDLYVSGPASALEVVISFCYGKGIALTLYHYRKEDASYKKQIVIAPCEIQVCQSCGRRSIGASFCPACGKGLFQKRGVIPFLCKLVEKK